MAESLYDKALYTLSAKDLLKLSTGITKTVNDKHLISIALMLVLAKVDRSILLSDKKDDITTKYQWNDFKKYLSQPKEVYD